MLSQEILQLEKFDSTSDIQGHGALVFSLRLLAVIDLVAIVAVVMPATWMAAIHEWLGMGMLPGEPIVGYLTRSASAMYALHGGIILYVSFDIIRYAPLIKFLALTALLHGVCLVIIDCAVGMPLFWTIAEGPVYFLVGVMVLCFQRSSFPAGQGKP